MTSQGSAQGRFQRALKMGSIFHAEIAARELGGLSLQNALDYCALLARVEPERFERAALRWHGRLELERRGLSFDRSALALAGLRALPADHDQVLPLLQRLIR